ncbi:MULTISPECIES: MFS transporter [Aerococcus]|uniref:MFS transporter n=1 Tax=Aerococcus tenax TaxID=3078812 RepID=A0A5N1BDY8_9LACT|nr:MFS transporter [Aerococcus urinae]KAA9238278.1 MFS transporter [Aerococcus urinae]MDK6598365.1 MFS transporter [Aerococcus urinae]MDK7302983.1 MFS transporter [Aerococcus urinae]MDK7801265.1 MFS transporter [Aerococcus urinae]MDK8655195.1 MFS transporter [Aerococcus urinae]
MRGNKKLSLRQGLPLLANYGVSLIGDALYLFAINWFLVSQTQNTALLGKINSISTSILLFSNLLVGPLVDQLNRKKLLIFSDLMSFIACLVCSVLYKDYLADQLILILTSAILSLALAINSPAAKAIVPHVVFGEDIERFNSIQNTLSSIIKIGAPIIGSLILSINNNFNFFILINALSFLLSALIIASVPYHENTHLAASQSFRFYAHFVSGLKYVYRMKAILGVMVFISLLNFIMTSYDLVIPYAINVLLKGSDKIYSLVLSTEALGGILGGVILTYQGSGEAEESFIQDVKYLALVLFMAGFFHSIYFVFLCALVNGYYLVQINAKVFTIIQKHSKQNFLGRVFSLLFVFSTLFSPIANYVFGKIIPFMQWQSFTLAAVGVLLVSYGINKFFFAGQ